MPNNNITFSILTPTWNRCAYLSRVYKGLMEQSYRSFEWIVADDGSTDGTEVLIRHLASYADFPVKYIRADRHVGKIRMDNKAVEQAKGLLVIWCDSDDYLLPNALERLWETWNTIPILERAQYVGITALAATKKGHIENPFPNIDFKDISWNDLTELHHVTGDMVFCVRSDILKAHPFPEVDLYIPESVVWTSIGYRIARLLSEALLIKEYHVGHAVSFTNTMNYNRGRAYAMAETVKNLQNYQQSWLSRIWRLTLFIRYSIHGEISVKEAREIWGNNSDHLSYWLIFPIACLVAAKDRLQGKVRWSHREFIANRDIASICIERLN